VTLVKQRHGLVGRSLWRFYHVAAEAELCEYDLFLLLKMALNWTESTLLALDGSMEDGKKR
jgi:hypothetical protein